MPKLTVSAPAKVNLHLRVLNRRPDGFHDIQSIFLALSFGDTLHFEPLSPDLALEIVMKPHIPMEENIIFKAVSLFRRQTGFFQGLRIRVEKQIPLGSGLGGGSSDAAAALLAMNTLAARVSPACPLDFAALSALAASLGSDVPFFLSKTRAAWVGGRGENIRPLEIHARLWFVLVNPGFSSDTTGAFRLLDQFRREKMPGADFQAMPENVVIEALSQAPRTWPFENDFLPVFLADSGIKTAYQEILDRLRDEGAEFAGLSGAGSTCFGVFSDKKSAVKAKNRLLNDWNFVKVTFLLAY